MIHISTRWRISNEVVLIVLIVASQLDLYAHAEHHYCVNGLTLSLRLDDYYHRDALIIPELPHEPIHNRLHIKRCRWSVSFDSAMENLQLVLEGIPAVSFAHQGHSTGNLRIESLKRRSRRIVVSPGMFHVMPLDKKTSFDVVTSWNPRLMMSRAPVNLRVRIPLSRICSLGMLSFRGHCYTRSSTPTSFADALNSVEGDAQLASFNSLAEIRDFWTANMRKKSKFPYGAPLSLDQPMRLGMLLRAADSSVLALAGRNASGGCALRPVSNLQDFGLADDHQTAGPCAFLRVAGPDGGLAVDFDNCSTPMASLLRFPETAAASAAPSPSVQCNGSELELMTTQWQKEMRTRHQKSEWRHLRDDIKAGTETMRRQDLDKKPISPTSVGMPIPALAFIIVAGMVSATACVLALLRRWKSRLKSNQSSTSGETHSEGTTV